MSDIQELITTCEQLCIGGNVNSRFTHRGKYPLHLRAEVSRIQADYNRYGHISMADEQFLLIMSRSERQWLMDHAYILGQWIEWRSYKHKNYNLKRMYGSKSVKKLKRPHYYSNL